MKLKLLVRRMTLCLAMIGLLALAFMPLRPVRALTPMVLAYAAPAQVVLPPFDGILSAMLIITAGFASLVGMSKLNAALVNLLKLTPIVQDGTSAKWVAGFNLVAFVALVIFKVFRPDLTLDVLDGVAGQIATVVIFVLGLLVTMTGSKSMHEALKEAKVPLIGTSFSG